ncbi:hypothetical protein BZA77DRAFT_295650 [Pyronema omphalodes]|nr:hypothetical protein BZA77DRAFT_295650 [Pyronema omphalodes]
MSCCADLSLFFSCSVLFLFLFSLSKWWLWWLIFRFSDFHGGGGGGGDGVLRVMDGWGDDGDDEDYDDDGDEDDDDDDDDSDGDNVVVITIFNVRFMDNSIGPKVSKTYLPVVHLTIRSGYVQVQQQQQQ